MQGKGIKGGNRLFSFSENVLKLAFKNAEITLLFSVVITSGRAFHGREGREGKVCFCSLKMY